MRKRKIKNNRGLSRTRNYATVVYPDSASENWLDVLSNEHVPAFVSPLHNQDINPTGEPKKSHWHVMVMFDSVKTVDQAKELFDKISGVGCEKVKSIRGSARYLCHMDNPEKAQYNPENVRCLCGADYHKICSLVSDKYAAISDMLEFCEDNDIVCFMDLVTYSRKNRQDWFRMLCDGAGFFIKECIKSKCWGKSNGKLRF